MKEELIREVMTVKWVGRLGFVKYKSIELLIV